MRFSVVVPVVETGDRQYVWVTVEPGCVRSIDRDEVGVVFVGDVSVVGVGIDFEPGKVPGVGVNGLW